MAKMSSVEREVATMRRVETGDRREIPTYPPSWGDPPGHPQSPERAAWVSCRVTEMRLGARRGPTVRRADTRMSGPQRELAVRAANWRRSYLLALRRDSS